MVLVVVDGKENIGFVDDADDLLAVEHGELRDVVEPHARIGDEQGVVGLDGVVVVIGVAPRDQVAQVAEAFALGEALVDLVLASGAEAVGGPALGAVPIAMAVGLASQSRGRDLPVFVVRMEQKQHGAKDLIAEPYTDDGGALITKGRRIAIVEDAITTGGSVRQALSAIEELGAEVTLVAVLVERHEGGGDKLRADGYDVVSLFRTDEDGKLTINESFLERLAAAQKTAS